MGFKDWGYANYFGDFFTGKGFCVLTFNFSHNGIGENKTELTEFEKFSKNTFTLEVEELDEIVNAVYQGEFGKMINPEITLVGHSRGGAIALLTALKNNIVKVVVTWGSVATLDRYTDRQKKKFREKGFMTVLNPSTKVKMKISTLILDDIETNKDTTLNIKNAVKKLQKPLLIIHGEKDMIVKSNEAKEIYSWSNKNISELRIIPNTGHTFGITHPFNGANSKFEKVLNYTYLFIEKT
jgi:pimeloyl-ACP methyl ester carboxylesterase